ncbi:hypothetical protein P7C73_g1656, partial [Tremellales sp. Uapishka_1]
MTTLLPHASLSHPALALELVLSDTSPVVAGSLIEGTLQVESKVIERLSLGVIEVEVVGLEGMGHSLGPTVPLSNACDPISTSRGYHVARKGRTAFPISIPIPVHLPSAIHLPGADIRYSLRAVVHLEYNTHKAILYRSTELDIVQSLSEVEVAVERRAEGEIPGVKVGIKTGWGVSGGRASVELEIETEGVRGQTGPPRLSLIRVLTIHRSGGRTAMEAETACGEQTYYDEQYRAAPHSESFFYLNLPLQGDLRSIPRRKNTPTAGIEVSYRLVISIPSMSEAVTTSLPFSIYHPSSLPPQLWLDSTALSTEAIGYAAPSQRWSTPVEVMTSFFRPSIPEEHARINSSAQTTYPRYPPTPEVDDQPYRPPYPESPQPLHDDTDPALSSSGAYPQPSWVIHTPPTSQIPITPPRDPRSTQNSPRNQSSSSPVRPASVVGPRPLLNRRTSSRLSTATLSSPVVELLSAAPPSANVSPPISTPPKSSFSPSLTPILSPTPQSLPHDPSNDHSLSAKLGPGTVHGLEELVEREPTLAPKTTKRKPVVMSIFSDSMHRAAAMPDRTTSSCAAGIVSLDPKLEASGRFQLR